MYRWCHPWEAGHEKRGNRRQGAGYRLQATGYRGQETGDRRQETEGRRRFQNVSSNVKNVHPRSAEADHPRRRGTRGQ